MGTTKESGRGVKCRAGDTWTESRYFQFIRSALRAAWNKYPVKGQVLRAARRSTTVSKTKKHRFEYRCAVCDKNYIGSQVQVDHINPCGSLKTYEDLPRFVATLFCEADNLQVICTTCHSDKTQAEREAKKNARD